MSNSTSRKQLYMLLFIAFPLFFTSPSVAQVPYTADDSVRAYNGPFRFGINPGYYPNWTSAQLGEIMAGNPALGLKGVGINTARPALYEEILETFGYDALISTFEGYYQKGIRDMNIIVGGPSGAHRDPSFHCPNNQSALFANIYEPIWDGGANGTPVNDNNYYALYLWKTVTTYKKYVRIWEILNEPDFDFSGVQWQGDFRRDIGWWVNNPQPCDYQLYAPIQHYVRMLRISWEVIKTADPTAHVEIGALGYAHFLDAVLRNTDNPSGGTVTPQYPKKGGAYFDLMGFHIYPHIDASLWTYRLDINQITGFHRHSDATIDSGLLKKQRAFDFVLNKYGYNGQTFKAKPWTVTEFNLPRRAFSNNYIGNDEIQRNSVMKAAIQSIKSKYLQLHVYQLGDKTTFSEATFEFDLMGMYKKLTTATPFNVEVNPVGIGYKTTSDLLFGSFLDSARTAAMNLPNTVGGGAFRFPAGNYVYCIWAKTNADFSESVFVNYSFPAALGIANLEKREWNYSQTNFASNIPSTNIGLTAAPIFLATAFLIPVELVYFKGKMQNNVAYLNWETVSESGTSHFDVEKSSDGLTFEKFAEVKAKGTTQTPQYYRQTDAQPFANLTYYRLKINDLDGKLTYSKVVALAASGGSVVRVSPNPFDKKISLNVLNTEGVQNLNLTLTDVSGRVLRQQKLTTSTDLLTEDLPSGIYFLQIVGGNKTETHKLMKF